MFRHILVPLDGSLQAERVLPLAARLARASDGILILLRTVTAIPEKLHKRENGAHLFQVAIQSAREEAQQYLTRIASTPPLTDLPTVISIQQGSVIAAIQNTIETYQVDLLVGCDRPGPPGSVPFLGSLVEQPCQCFPVPCLLLPSQERLDGSLMESKQPMFLVAFAGKQPEPFLIQSAAALLAVLAGQEPGHLHFAPQCVVLSRLASLRLAQQAMVRVQRQRPVSPRLAALVEKVRSATGSEHQQECEKADMLVLETPFSSKDGNLLREIDIYPRLLIPCPEKAQQAASHA